MGQKVGLRGPRIFQQPTYASPMILRLGNPLPSSSEQASPSESQPGEAHHPTPAVSTQVRDDGALSAWSQGLKTPHH